MVILVGANCKCQAEHQQAVKQASAKQYLQAWTMGCRAFLVAVHLVAVVMAMALAGCGQENEA